MPYNPSNYHQQQRGNLDYLFEALGIRELFERVAELDGGDGPMDEVGENPTGDPAVQPNMEGVGSYSGGPIAENDGSMATHEPNLIAQIKKDAESEEPESDEEAEENAFFGETYKEDTSNRAD